MGIEELPGKMKGDEGAGEDPRGGMGSRDEESGR